MVRSVEHLSEFGPFTSRPFPFALKAVGGLAARLAANDGSITRTAASLFADKGIQVEALDTHGNVMPDDKLPSADGRGSLLVGCHRKGTEPALLAGLLGRNDTDMHIFVKPPSLQAQGLAAIAERMDEDGHTVAARRALQSLLPLFTPKPSYWQRSLWKWGKATPLPTADACAANNQLAAQKAAGYMEQGDGVVIFPTGSIRNAMTHPWHPGFVRSMLAVDPEQRDAVDVHFFRPRNYTSRRYLGAVALDHEAPRKPVQIVLSPVGSLGAILDAYKEPYNEQAIAADLHGMFRAHFAHER
jgi:hypothetical protein